MDLESILNSLLKKKKPKPYASVFEQGDMSSPNYRAVLEEQQGLEGSYPELLMMGLRGFGGAGKSAASVDPVQIGRHLPVNYKPFEELSNIDRQLATLSAERKTAQSRGGEGWLDGLSGNLSQWDHRLGPEIALMLGRSTADRFETSKHKRLQRQDQYNQAMREREAFFSQMNNAPDNASIAEIFRQIQ